MALRLCLTFLLVATWPGLVHARQEAVQVTLDYVAKKAEERAQKPFRSPRADLPDVLKKLDYDSYREIEFRHDQALWSRKTCRSAWSFFIPVTFTRSR